MPSNINIRHLDNFNTISYDFSGNHDNVQVKNITQYIDLLDPDPRDLAYYRYYEMLEGETPDMISTKLYGSPEYYWLLFLFNDHLKNGLNGWYLSDDQMEKYFEKEYDPYFWLSGTTGGHSENSQFTINSQELYDIPLDDKYLPHLRITYRNSIELPSSEIAPYSITSLKIKSYDHERYGLIVNKPTELQYVKVNIEGLTSEIIDTNLILYDDLIHLDGGLGGGVYTSSSDKSWYNGIQITQATGKSRDYVDPLDNVSNLIFTAGPKYVGKEGNKLTVRLKYNSDQRYLNSIFKPVVSEETFEDVGERTVITIEFGDSITLGAFREYINNLNYDNNLNYELLPFSGISSIDSQDKTNRVEIFAITHDESDLGWEWQRKCYDLGLKGDNVNPGPWIEEEFLEKDKYCQPIYKTYLPDSSQRASIHFNCLLFYSFDQLRNATYEFYNDIYWSPEIDILPHPGLIPEADVEEYKKQYNVIQERDIDSFYDVITNEVQFQPYRLDSRITFQEHEFTKNLNRRKLRVPRTELVSELSDRYRTLLNLTI